MRNKLLAILFCSLSIGMFAQMETKEQQLNKAFDSIVKSGDSLFAMGRYDESINSFLKALALKPMEVEMMDKIKIAEIGLQVEKFRSSADRFFLNCDYVKAKENYIKILHLKVNDENAFARINEIDEILHKGSLKK